jgi:hypothetical protein
VVYGRFIIVAAVKEAYSASTVPLWERSLPRSEPDAAANDAIVIYVVQLSNNILLKKSMHYSHESDKESPYHLVTHLVNRHAVRESLIQSVNHLMSQRVTISTYTSPLNQSISHNVRQSVTRPFSQRVTQ